MDNQECRRLYDPDPTTPLMMVLTAITALGSLAGALAFIDQVKEKHKNSVHEKRVRKSVERELKYSFLEVSQIMQRMEQKVGYLTSFIENSAVNSGFKSYLKERVMLGGRPLLLDEYEYRHFQMTQGDILDELGHLMKNIAVIERVLAEDGEYFAERYHFRRAQQEIEELMSRANMLMRGFHEHTFDYFLHEIGDICKQAGYLGRWIERKDNNDL